MSGEWVADIAGHHFVRTPDGPYRMACTQCQSAGDSWSPLGPECIASVAKIGGAGASTQMRDYADEITEDWAYYLTHGIEGAAPDPWVAAALRLLADLLDAIGDRPHGSNMSEGLDTLDRIAAVVEVIR